MDRRKLLTAGLVLAGGAVVADKAAAQAQAAQSSSSSDISPATLPEARDAAARAPQANQPVPIAKRDSGGRSKGN